MALGARMVSEEEALRFVDLFVSTPFRGEARHARRIAQLVAYESIGELPEVPSAVP